MDLEQKKQEIDEMTDEERTNCRANWNGWIKRGREVETAQAIVAYIDSLED